MKKTLIWGGIALAVVGLGIGAYFMFRKKGDGDGSREAKAETGDISQMDVKQKPKDVTSMTMKEREQHYKETGEVLAGYGKGAKITEGAGMVGTGKGYGATQAGQGKAGQGSSVVIPKSGYFTQEVKLQNMNRPI